MKTTLHLSLTVTGGMRVWVVPSAVCLALNDPMALVVISRVAREHHHGVILALSPVN